MSLSRFEITPAEIDRVVADFYVEIRQHPMLGAIFARHVTDWPAHEEKVAAFWRNAILLERGYDGNPMAVHKAAGNVRPGMFLPWLDLFHTVLQRHLTPEQAAAWNNLARRIGASLSYGLIDQGGPGGIPNLRGQA